MVRRIRRITSYRRAMWAWMNGPGRKFRDPFTKGTNYLGAYDLKTGIRLPVARGSNSTSTNPSRRNRDGLDDSIRKSSNDALNRALDAQESEYDDTDAAAATDNLGDPNGEPEDFDPLDNDGSLAGEIGKRTRGAAHDTKGGPDALGSPHSTTGAGSAVVRFPPGFDTSLYPFPLNAYFRSQPVLSEELRQEIFERVVERGWSVREVSAAMGVSMERVAAVVRLGEVERRWESEVCGMNSR